MAEGTIERAAELKVAQKAVLYAIALDDPVSRTPSRNLELQNMATDQSKDGPLGFFWGPSIVWETKNHKPVLCLA